MLAEQLWKVLEMLFKWEGGGSHADSQISWDVGQQPPPLAWGKISTFPKCPPSCSWKLLMQKEDGSVIMIKVQLCRAM